MICAVELIDFVGLDHFKPSCFFNFQTLMIVSTSRVRTGAPVKMASELLAAHAHRVTMAVSVKQAGLYNVYA